MRRSRLCLFLACVCAVATLSAQASQSPASSNVTTLALTAETLTPLRQWDGRVDAMLRSGELAARTRRVDTVLSGRVHERYDQYVNGVRVWGGDVARQLRGGLTESIYGTLYQAITVDTTPSISEDGAREILGRLGEAELPADRRIELVVLPRDAGGYALTWRTHVWTNEGWMHTFINAHTGVVELQYNDLQTQSAVGTGTGVLGDTKKVSTRMMAGRYVADDQLRPPVLVTYDMGGDLNRTIVVLYYGWPVNDGDLASDSDNAWTDRADVDAHVHLGWTYDYLYKQFGRRGIDDSDAPIKALTHPVRRADIFRASSDIFGRFFVNAFWCAGCGADGRGMMVFGEGLPEGFVARATGRYYDYFAGALDIVAHELTHAVTTYSSNLEYRNESGALSESFSDILGTGAEFFYQAPGNGQQQADYRMGEDISRPGGDRSMSDPQSFGHPDHYSRRYRGLEDFGGVHTNSGIPNHAFYLAIEGGVNRTSGLNVTGVGAANREQIEKAFYRAFVYKLTSRATFSNARVATIDAARELYGAGSPAERAITEAWTAVGVF